MTPEQQAIVEEIKIHIKIIQDLTLKLNSQPVQKKKTKGLTPEESAMYEARFLRKMFKP